MRLLKLALKTFVLKYFNEFKKVASPIFLMNKINESFKVMLDLIVFTTECYKLHVLLVKHR